MPRASGLGRPVGCADATQNMRRPCCVPSALYENVCSGMEGHGTDEDGLSDAEPT